MDFFKEAGCPIKVERGDRVFPVSDHSQDVIAALIRELKRLSVDILLNTEVKELLTRPADRESKEKAPLQEFVGVRCKDQRLIQGDACILCTGGISYPATGSTGDGYEFAGSCGHTVVECRPALVPLETQEEWCRELMGLSLRNVSVRMMSGQKEIYSGFGEMLFTHFGVSGPLIISASSYYSKLCGSKRPEKGKEGTKLYIDLKPALDLEQLDKRILRDFEKNKNRQFKNSLNELLPIRLIPVLIGLSCIDPNKQVNEITKEERRGFAHLIKALPLTITKTRSFAEAIITQGGVSVKHVNPSTMESKLVKSLYFAGEVLDLDAMTGGFNLQIAWSTGYLAGQSAGME